MNPWQKPLLEASSGSTRQLRLGPLTAEVLPPDDPLYRPPPDGVFPLENQRISPNPPAAKMPCAWLVVESRENILKYEAPVTLPQAWHFIDETFTSRSVFTDDDSESPSTMSTTEEEDDTPPCALERAPASSVRQGPGVVVSTDVSPTEPAADHTVRPPLGTAVTSHPLAWTLPGRPQGQGRHATQVPDMGKTDPSSASIGRSMATSDPEPSTVRNWSYRRFLACLAKRQWRTNTQEFLKALSSGPFSTVSTLTAQGYFDRNPDHAKAIATLARTLAKEKDRNSAGYTALLFLFTVRNPNWPFTNPKDEYSLLALLPRDEQTGRAHWPIDILEWQQVCLDLWHKKLNSTYYDDTAKLVLSLYGH